MVFQEIFKDKNVGDDSMTRARKIDDPGSRQPFKSGIHILETERQGMGRAKDDIIKAALFRCLDFVKRVKTAILVSQPIRRIVNASV